MAFTISDEFLPATLNARPMTDEQFADFCAEHPDLFFEMTAEGELIVMPPTYSITGARNAKITGQLSAWAERQGLGIVFDSSSGFVLPNGARRSPDASWILRSRIESIAPLVREKFLHLCPDFVIELKSPSDRPRMLRRKMEEYLSNGAQLGWLIDPATRTVEIYRPGREAELLAGLDVLPGEAPVEGFTLRLPPVWDPLAA